MNKIVHIILGFTFIFTSQVANAQIVDAKQRVIVGKDCDTHGGADMYAKRGDNPHSKYYVNPDYFNLVSNDTLTIITHFQTMQQTTEWSCGDVAALLVLRHFGCMDQTEWSLACAMKSMTDRTRPGSQPGTAKRYADFGTSLAALHDYFASREDFHIVQTNYRTNFTSADLVKDGDLYPACDYGNLYPTFASSDVFAVWLTEQLKQKLPVMVEWNDWDGHWVVIIGIDNNGTPDFYGDDILIFANPYDITDHRQDGYSIASLGSFFYSWQDRAIAPKPYQLQPFLVVNIK